VLQLRQRWKKMRRLLRLDRTNSCTVQMRTDPHLAASGQSGLAACAAAASGHQLSCFVKLLLLDNSEHGLDSCGPQRSCTMSLVHLDTDDPALHSW
jgi:hypothetical protein